METATIRPAHVGEDEVQIPATRLRIAIVEDMQSYSELLRNLCERSWGMDVIMVARTGVQAYAAIVRLRPEVILLDLGLPDLDGVDLAARLRRGIPSARIVVMSGTCCNYQLHRLGRIEIHGYFDKFSDELLNLRHAVELASRGATYFSPVYARAHRLLRRSGTAFFKLLSEREQDVLRQISFAKSDLEIGVELGISVTTVQTHRRELMRKLGIHSTPKLVRYGMELGFAALPTLQSLLEQG